MTEPEIETTTTNGPKGNMLAVGVVLVAVVVGIGFMLTRSIPQSSNSLPTSQPGQEASPAISPSPAVEAATDAQVTKETRVIQIEAGSFYYKPNEIKLKIGEKVKFEITSKDQMHDFNIDELNVKIPVTKAGNTLSVEYTADTVGTFEYYCSVGQHRKNGQFGKLIVE